jgi:hypothetical protein
MEIDITAETLKMKAESRKIGDKSGIGFELDSF